MFAGSGYINTVGHFLFLMYIYIYVCDYVTTDYVLHIRSIFYDMSCERTVLTDLKSVFSNVVKLTTAEEVAIVLKT